MELFVIFFTFFIATVFSSMSGAGTSVITLPVLLYLGVNIQTQIVISQISGIFWVLPASYNYLKDRKIDWIFLLFFTSLGFIGVFVGVSANIQINQRYLKTIIGLIIISLVIYAYLNKGLGLKEKKGDLSIFRKLLAYPFSLFLGFYEGFFGTGNGILFTITTFYTKGFDFIDALGHYYAVVFFWLIFSVFLYTKNGYFDLRLTIPAILGSVLGGFVGSKFGKYKGNKVIKLIFIVLGSLLGIKLILGF